MLVPAGGLRSSHVNGVDVLLRDLAVARDVRVVDVAELVVAMGEAPEPMTAALMAFEMFIRADNEGDERDRAGEFDPAIGDDLRLAPECQGEDHVVSKMR